MILIEIIKAEEKNKLKKAEQERLLEFNKQVKENSIFRKVNGWKTFKNFPNEYDMED